MANSAKAKEAASYPDGDGAAGGLPRRELALEAGAPEIYFNGFVTGLSAGDVYCVLERNGRPAGVLNMSFTTAKSFGVSVGRVIAALEDLAERDIMTTDDVIRILNEPDSAE